MVTEATLKTPQGCDTNAIRKLHCNRQDQKEKSLESIYKIRFSY